MGRLRRRMRGGFEPVELRRYLACLCSGLLMLLSGAAGGDRSRENPVTIGFHKQLLVDDYLLAKTLDVTRELGQVTKANGGEPLNSRDTILN